MPLQMIVYKFFFLIYYLKSHWVLFPAGTIEEAKEKKKKVPIVPETLKKKWKNFAEFKIKHLRKKLDPKML